MYCHGLDASNGIHSFSIQCEDLPEPGNVIGIWLYDSDFSKDFKKMPTLLPALIEWANSINLNYRIYTSPDNFITPTVLGKKN